MGGLSPYIYFKYLSVITLTDCERYIYTWDREQL